MTRGILVTIVLPHSRFLHVPKTGGTWVSRALRHSGLCLAFCEDPHPPRSTAPGSGLFTFAFVRNPLAWYPSYWEYRARTGWNECKPFDRDCRATTFRGFMELVFDRHPGYYGRLVRQYVGPPDNPIDFVGRQETLAADLLAALDLAGEQYAPDFPGFVSSYAPANVSAGIPVEHPADYAPRVYRMDADVFARFGYTTDYAHAGAS